MDGPATVKTQRQRVLGYFHEIEIEDSTTITELIQRFQTKGYVMSIASLAITMPTYGYIKDLQNCNHVKSFTDAETEVNRRRTYELLINKHHAFQAKISMNKPSDTLDIMDSFNYIKSLAKREVKWYL